MPKRNGLYVVKSDNGVVSTGEGMGIDQILMDGHDVATQPQLGLDEVAVDFE